MEVLDAIAQAGQAQEALRRVDRVRLAVAPGSIFSIQQNVTTADDPAGEVRLRRFYSSEPDIPINGRKLKKLTPWSDRLFVQGMPFVGEGADVLALHFDDYPQMRRFGVQSVINVPFMRQHQCFATFNVFGARPCWLPQEILALRLLALAAASWVPITPGLHYVLDPAARPPSRPEASTQSVRHECE